MKVELEGKRTGVGAFKDGKVFRKNIEKDYYMEIDPIRTESSRTGNHWTHIYDCKPTDIIVEWGYSRGGSPFYKVKYVESEEKISEEEQIELAKMASGDDYIAF